MEQREYQVLGVKPRDLEDALNQAARQGWRVESIMGAESAGRSWFWWRTMDVTKYHVILWRPA
ncbi:MAG TPA: hypothetical protein VFB58_10865 [Chloroflexota bacterium]|nr:hypothetical protein [Chloroflexota bacterium]